MRIELFHGEYNEIVVEREGTGVYMIHVKELGEYRKFYMGPVSAAHLIAALQAVMAADKAEADCQCERCRASAQLKLALHPAECAVCRTREKPISQGPDGLYRCRACGGDGA